MQYENILHTLYVILYAIRKDFTRTIRHVYCMQLQYEKPTLLLCEEALVAVSVCIISMDARMRSLTPLVAAAHIYHSASTQRGP